VEEVFLQFTIVRHLTIMYNVSKLWICKFYYVYLHSRYCAI